MMNRLSALAMVTLASVSTAYAGRRIVKEKVEVIRNRDLTLRSTSTKRTVDGELAQEVRVHLRSKIGELEKQVSGQILVIYKLPVQGGVYCYTLQDLGIDFEETKQWKKTLNVPQKRTVKLKYDGEAQASNKEVTFYDYMLIIKTSDEKPLLYSTKTSWKRIQPKLMELGADKPFDSRAKPVKKLARLLTPEEQKAARLKRNGVK